MSMPTPPMPGLIRVEARRRVYAALGRVVPRDDGAPPPTKPPVPFVGEDGCCPKGALWFYGTRGAYYCFSNFSPHPVVAPSTPFSDRPMTYQTTEHYFQAYKFVGKDDWQHFKDAATAKGPARTKSVGGDRSRPLRRDWEAAKDDVMLDALWLKVHQHPDVMTNLLSTADLVIVEDAPKDPYWGTGGDNNGRNQLGISWMIIREALSMVQDQQVPPVATA